MKINMIEKIFNKLGYYKRPKYEPFLTEMLETQLPYKRNGIWYEVYDNIQENNDINDVNSKIAVRLNNTEYARWRAFKNDHTHNGDKQYKDGPKHWIGFVGTGIGNCVYCKCDICGETFDITDNSSW